MGVADGVADLLKGAAGGEHGEGGGEGNQAHGGHTGGHADHVGLGDAAVEVAVREGLLEGLGLGGVGQVGVQNHQILMLRTQRGQSLAVGITGSNFFHVCHNHLPSTSARAAFSSFIAIAYSSSLGALPCQEAWPSMKETPLPLVVFITMAVGLPFTVLAVLKAASI